MRDRFDRLERHIDNLRDSFQDHVVDSISKSAVLAERIGAAHRRLDALKKNRWRWFGVYSALFIAIVASLMDRVWKLFGGGKP